MAPPANPFIVVPPPDSIVHMADLFTLVRLAVESELCKSLKESEGGRKLLPRRLLLIANAFLPDPLPSPLSLLSFFPTRIHYSFPELSCSPEPFLSSSLIYFPIQSGVEAKESASSSTSISPRSTEENTSTSANCIIVEQDVRGAYNSASYTTRAMEKNPFLDNAAQTHSLVSLCRV